MTAEKRLNELDLSLPEVPTPAGSYRHAVRSGKQLFLSAKGSVQRQGKVGAELNTEQGYTAAREAGLMLLAVLREELGSLDRVRQVIKVNGTVNADPRFLDHPKVINGCSDLLLDVFGERGRHARSAVGVDSLPGGIAVAIDVIVEVD